MSVIASYARVSQADLEALKADPERFWRLREMDRDLGNAANVEASERLDIDKDWVVLSWLCSDVGRAEERYQAALMNVDTSLDDDRFKTALAREAAAMGFEYIDPRDLPDEPLLTALQGRREGDCGPTVSGLGMAAADLQPDEVVVLAAALSKLEEAWLRARFDIDEIVMLGLPADGEASELDEFYLPQLERLQALYARAAQAGQHVVVVIS